MLVRDERPCVGLAVGETQDLSSSCNTIFRCRMNSRQWSLLSYSSSASPTNISITNNKMCNGMTATAIIQSYKYVKWTAGLVLMCSDAQNVQRRTKMCSDEKLFVQ